MTDTYPHMSKINELAAELDKHLEMYKNTIYSEISYAAYCELGTETEYWMLRGYDEESARDKANDELEKSRFEHGFETPYDDELETIEQARKILEKLKSKQE